MCLAALFACNMVCANRLFGALTPLFGRILSQDYMICLLRAMAPMCWMNIVPKFM